MYLGNIIPVCDIYIYQWCSVGTSVSSLNRRIEKKGGNYFILLQFVIDINS